MAWCLRMFLSERHQRGFGESWIPDRLLEDPLFDERFEHIRAQIAAALASHSVLTELQIVWNDDNSVDLLPLIDAARRAGLLNHTEEGILVVLNRRGNAAKHSLVFRSRL